MSLPVTVRILGLLPYNTALELQKKLHARIVAGTSPSHLLICSHPPVITLGTSGHEDQIRAAPDELVERNIKIERVGRGGKATYHCPEQILCYPLFDLRELRRDVSWYMRCLEEVVIRALARQGVHSDRIQDRTGVWIRNSTKNRSEPCKIASIGVKLSRWCSYHGVAINLLPCDEGFSLIDPCGFPGLPITSLEEERGGPITVSTFIEELINQFQQVFDLSVVSIVDEQNLEETSS
jgi:lipoyl(octanoyl) transferase